MASHVRRLKLPTEQSANSSALGVVAIGAAKIEGTASIKKANLKHNAPVKGSHIGKTGCRV
jgi:hypothetical protein